MTDRELLERAALAAGLQQTHDDGGPYFIRPGCEFQEWNPLDDDGDALRLAVKLHMHIQVDDEDLGEVFVFLDAPGPFVEESGADPCAALRRAIVRAAAAMAPEVPV